MREILFRGIMKYENSRYKRGQWVIGDLVRLQDGNDGKPHIYGYGEVFPDTVGQYTGYKIDDIKVFENDIAKVHLEIPYLPHQDKAIDDIGVVCFDTEDLRYYVVSNTGEKYALCYIKEIVGNIHDNPDYCKEGFVVLGIKNL